MGRKINALDMRTKKKISAEVVEDIPLEKIVDNIAREYALVDDIQGDKKYIELTKKFLKIYKRKMTKVKDNSEIESKYVDFVYKTVAAEFCDIITKEDLKALRAKTVNSAWKMKQRWYKKCIKSLESKKNEFILKEHEEVLEEYIKNERIVRDDLEIDDPNDLIEYRKTYLEKWVKDSNLMISDFPYLGEMSMKKIESAFARDLVLCMTERLRSEYSYDFSRLVVRNISGLPPALFNNNRRGRKSEKDLMQKREDNLYEGINKTTKGICGDRIDVTYEFYLPDEAECDIGGLKLELANEITEPNARRKLSLDEKDLEIAKFVYNYDASFYYKIYLKEIIDELGLVKNQDSYDEVEARLLKLPFYTFYARKYDVNGNLEKRTVFNLFSQVTTYKDENNRWIVEVRKAIVDVIEKRTMEVMYKNELKRLKTRSAKELTYVLEGNRITYIATGENVKETYYEYRLDFFKWYINTNKKTIKQQMKEIADALEEIKQNQFIIKDYKVYNTYFEVLFYEDMERRQKIFSRTTAPLPAYLKEDD